MKLHFIPDPYDEKRRKLRESSWEVTVGELRRFIKTGNGRILWDLGADDELFFSYFQVWKAAGEPVPVIDATKPSQHENAEHQRLRENPPDEPNEANSYYSLACLKCGLRFSTASSEKASMGCYPCRNY